MRFDMSFLLLLGLILLLAPLVISLWVLLKSRAQKERMDKLDDQNRSLLNNQKKLLKRLEVLETTSPPLHKPDEKLKGHETKKLDESRKDKAQTSSPPTGGKKTPQRPEQTPPGRPTSVPQAARVAQAAPVTMPPRKTSPASPGMEQQMGTRWTIWLGAVALGLGAVFMVRHSIDQGYLTPAIRVLFGFLLSAGLLAGGDFLRRRDIELNIPGVPGAPIPGALTAAGIVGAFATTYAAYALYGFLGPLPAFILLAAAAIAALAFSVLHGPALAAMGLVGSYVTPALVSTGHPDAWSLFPYLLFVTLASFVTARTRSWLWLAKAALLGSVIWGFIWFHTHWQPGDIVPVGGYILALLLAALVFLKQSEPTSFKKPAREPVLSAIKVADWPVSLGMAFIGLLAFVLMRHGAYSSGSWLILGLSLGLMLLCARAWRSMTLLAPLAAALFALTYGTWHFGWLVERVPSIDFITPPALTEFLIFGAFFAGAFVLIGFFTTLRRNGEMVWALTSTLTGVFAFVYAYWRATSFEHSLPFGFAALVLAAAATFATEQIDRTGRTNQTVRQRRYKIAGGIFATAAVTLLALAMTILLAKGWLTIALATITPALAYIARRRKMPVLGWLAAAIALLVAGRLYWEPRIMGADLGTTPIFNWLLYGYGLPALALALAASMFRKQRDDWVPALLEAAAILFIALLAFLEIRHFLYDGDIYSTRYDLHELSLHSAVWLSLALGYQWLYDRAGRFVPKIAALAFGVLGLSFVLIGHLLIMNPLLTGDFIGNGLIFNDLLLGYALPAGLCALLFSHARHNRSALFVKLAGFAAFALTFAWLTLQVRLYFNGGNHMILWRNPASQGEWYSYSAVWLAFGLALLLSGIALHQKMLRQAALGLAGLVIFKVFLSDMANLTGLLRALSFIGLGLALVGIGWLYQRVIFPQAGHEPLDKDAS